MKFTLNLAVTLLIVILLAACGGGGGSTSASSGLPQLSWSTPTMFTDGTPASSSDVGGYRIYFGASPGNYTTGNYDTSSGTLHINVTDLISHGLGTYYFVVTAVTNTSGLESDYSNEVHWKF